MLIHVTFDVTGKKVSIQLFSKKKKRTIGVAPYAATAVLICRVLQQWNAIFTVLGRNDHAITS